MIPSHFVHLDRIPLAPTGKVDRQALPAPARKRPTLERPMRAPSNPVEAWVARRWREQLDLDEVGVDDRFFDLGGTSMAALRLLGRLSEDAGTPLPTLLLFRAPTVAEMASILEREHGDGLPESLTASSTQFPSGSNGLAARAARQREELRERRLRRRHVP